MKVLGTKLKMKHKKPSQSKGSKARPRQVSHQEYSDNWDKIFGGKKDDKSKGSE